MTKSIRIWPWKSAPPQFRKLSNNGGDEDWIVYIPQEHLSDVDHSLWLDNIDSCAEPQKIQLKNGDWIFIGSHS